MRIQLEVLVAYPITADYQSFSYLVLWWKVHGRTTAGQGSWILRNCWSNCPLCNSFCTDSQAAWYTSLILPCMSSRPAGIATTVCIIIIILICGFSIIASSIMINLKEIILHLNFLLNSLTDWIEQSAPHLLRWLNYRTSWIIARVWIVNLHNQAHSTYTK